MLSLKLEFSRRNLQNTNILCIIRRSIGIATFHFCTSSMNDEDNLNGEDESTVTLADVEGKDEHLQPLPTDDETSRKGEGYNKKPTSALPVIYLPFMFIASCEIFVEFLEVAIHQILFVSKLYPKETFITRKKYNVPVHISGHPGLTQYIIDALDSLIPLLKEDKVCNVAVLIKNGEIPCKSKDEDYISLHQNLRSFLLRILSGNYNSDVEMKDSSSFEILVGCYADDEVHLNVLSNRTTKWARVDDKDFPVLSGKLTAIKAITDSPILKMQLLCGHLDQTIS